MTQESARHIRFKGRSFPVLTLEPEAPLDGWIEQLDALLEQSPGFFARKSIVIDAARLELEQSGLTELVDKLNSRGIRMMGIAGVDMAWASDDLPPILARGRAIEIPGETANENASAKPLAPSAATEAEASDDAKRETAEGDAVAADAGGENSAEPATAKADAETKSAREEKHAGVPLIIKDHVRSGQSIYHPEGDVTVIGSVSSGAEILAGGSVHIYGVLRGRAMAGAYGDRNARIFCRKLEAELISVCGVYLTAEEISPDMQRQPIQAWLENETVKIARLD